MAPQGQSRCAGPDAKQKWSIPVPPLSLTLVRPCAPTALATMRMAHQSSPRKALPGRVLDTSTQGDSPSSMSLKKGREHASGKCNGNGNGDIRTDGNGSGHVLIRVCQHT